MTAPVHRWLKDQGLTVKLEFATPWSSCDLVGIEFDKRRVASRSQLKQSRPIGSESRAALLLEIADIETQQFTTVEEVLGDCDRDFFGEAILQNINRLVADRFVKREGDRLQKVNGWMPIQKRLVAVELKLRRIRDVVDQATYNLEFADESYVALPSDVAASWRDRLKKWPGFEKEGLGLLAVDRDGCRELIRPKRIERPLTGLRVYAAEKFWRTRSKDR